MGWIVEPGFFDPPFIGPSIHSYVRMSPVLRQTSGWWSSPSLGSLRCFIDYYTARTGNVWTISEHLIPGVKVGSDEADAQSAFYNGLPWFSGLDYSLFYSIIRGCWVLFDCTYPTEPRAALALDGETWNGDAWWEGGGDSFRTLPWTLQPKGSALNSGDDNTRTVELWWPRWTLAEGDGPCGVYEAVEDSGATGTKIVGVPVWTATIGRRTVEFVRSLKTENGGRYSYGALSWSRTRSAYVFGASADGSSWFETAAAPTVEGGAQLASKRLDENGDVADGEDDPIELVFDRYDFGDGTVAAALAEVVEWRST